jgi:hypothetical protein
MFGSSNRFKGVQGVVVPKDLSKGSYNEIEKRIPEDTTGYEKALESKPPKGIDEKTVSIPATYYTFIVKGDDIINIFESTSEIKLGSTYSHENKNLLPNNYITSSSEQNDFYSIFNKKTPINVEFENSNKYVAFGVYANLQPETWAKSSEGSLIKFYVYKFDTLGEPKIYYTYGNIFVYNYGIMSTCEIFETVDESVLTKINVNVLKRSTPLIDIGITENKSVTANKTKYDDLISKIKDQVFSSKKESIVIHYLNAILPKDIGIFNVSEKYSFLKILYVNISIPEKSEQLDDWNILHTYINYYYAYKEKKAVKTSRNIDEYVKLQESNGVTKYYSDFSMHIFDFFEFLMFLKDKDTELKYINLCINMYQQYYTSFSKNKDLFTKPEMMKKIQTAIQKNLKGVNTFLQIINQDVAQYNEKFKIRLNKDGTGQLTNNTSMLIEYTASTKQFYDKDGKNIPNREDKSAYKKTYKFGPFNKIYEPITHTAGYRSYNEIAEKSNEFKSVIEKITPESPMMFSFHGPSGSGKSQIFDPIFIGLCKVLGTKGYTKLNVKFKEIFKKYDDKNVENVETPVFELTFQNGKYSMTSDTQHTPYHKTHIQILNKLKSVTPQENKTFKAGIDTLETVLKYFLEEDRLIKGITTNYNSSRSHVLCFLEFEKTDATKCYVIFDELAGNEKKYDCTNEKTLDKFKTINRKIGKEKYPFYENEFDLTGEIFDSYKGGSQQEDMIKSKSRAGERDLYNKLIKNACEHRDIEGDFINDSLKDFRKDLEYIVNVKNRDIEYYVPDIYNENGNNENSCLQDFCFGKINCFRLPKEKDPIVEPKSVILKSVYDYLLNKSGITDSTTFCDKLAVCIFGVLNISRAKNDPPSIHYVDINGVKSVIHHKDKFTFPFVKTQFEEKLKESNQFSQYLSGSAPYVHDLLTGCLHDFNNNTTTTNLNKPFPLETFKAVFDVIDDENAKTAIGTLEFMNKLSKFNAVNSICYETNVSDSYITYKDGLYN